MYALNHQFNVNLKIKWRRLLSELNYTACVLIITVDFCYKSLGTFKLT